MSPDPLTSIWKKIIPREEIEYKAAQWRKLNKTIVFTNGCFDIIHPGHIHLLAKARAKGDMLVVGINTDTSVSRLKGPNRPVNNKEVRTLQLAALELVDAVTDFDEDTPLELIRQIQPDVLVKGGDYQLSEVVGKAEVEEYGGKVEIIELLKGYSTSTLIEKLKK